MEAAHEGNFHIYTSSFLCDGAAKAPRRAVCVFPARSRRAPRRSSRGRKLSHPSRCNRHERVMRHELTHAENCPMTAAAIVLGDFVTHQERRHVVVAVTPMSVTPFRVELSDPETNRTCWVEWPPRPVERTALRLV
jgi:hypothetical protein